jgi:hypothetical protein
VRIEAQGRYLQSILEKAQKTLAGQVVESDGLEEARAELSNLATRVSNECFNTSFLRAPNVCRNPNLSSIITSISRGASERQRLRHEHDGEEEEEEEEEEDDDDDDDEEAAECSPESCLTHVSSERSDMACSRDLAGNAAKRSRLALRSSEGQAVERARLKEGVSDQEICSFGDVSASYPRSSCALNQEMRAERCEVYRNGRSKTLDSTQDLSMIKEEVEKGFHSIGRPEPRRAGLSAEQVLTLSISNKSSVIATSGDKLNPNAGNGLDLNKDGDGTKVEMKGFDLNGFVNGS